MEKFFHPRSVAVIGASPQEGKIGNILVKNLTALSYTGQVLPVNPKHNEIAGLKCYPSVQEINEAVDMAIIAIPAPLVVDAVKECANRSQPIKNIIIISAGFSESGDAGKQLEDEIVTLSQQYGLKIIGPNCLGVVNATLGLNASFSKNNFVKGRVGLIMQSGAFTTALFDLAKGTNFGFSLVATLGNKAVLDEVDFLEYMVNDIETEIIAMYLEDIRRGSEFCQALKKASAIKPVLILKAGNSERSQQAMQSHTGAMAGAAAVAEVAIKENGGYYFDNLDSFICAIKIFSGFKLPVGYAVSLVTNAGGPGVILTDLVEKSHPIHMQNLSEESVNSIKSVLPEAAATGNPIDVLGDAGPDRYSAVLENLKKIEGVGAVLALVTPQAQTDISAIATVLAQANEHSHFPIFPIVMGSEAASVADRILLEKGLTNFPYVTDLVEALGIIASHSQYDQSNDVAAVVSTNTQPDLVFSQAANDNRQAFFYSESKQLADQYGLSAVTSKEVNDVGQELGEIKFPLVMKVDDPELVHKNVKDAVILGIDGRRDFNKAFRILRRQFPGKKIIVQPQVPAGLEIIMGIKKDDRFGHVLMVGIGGILTEILGIKELWLLPTNEKSLKRKIESGLIGKIFKKKKIPVELLVAKLKAVSEIAKNNQMINELDVNPIIFYPDRDPIAVDIKVMFKS